MSGLLVADHVMRRFGAVVANDDVSLSVGAGEIVGLLGANGAGKTTLLRVLLGLLAPDAGTVRLPGGAPSRATRARIGYVPQGLGLWPDLTVRAHFALSARVYGRGTDVADTDVADLADRPVSSLPLGSRRRVAFALATAHGPDALVLDEPTSGIDPLGRARLWEAIHGVADAGTAVLVSTHHLDEAGMCDRVVMLAAGRVAVAGTADELTHGREAVEVRAARWPAVWAVLDDARLRVLPAGQTLRVTDATVEQVEAVVDGAGLSASVAAVPATLEEVFLSAAQGAG